MRLSAVAVKLLVVALGLFAYWGVIHGDPGAQLPRGVGEIEAWFFVPGADVRLVMFGAAALLLHDRRHRLRQALGAPTGPFPSCLLLLPATALGLWSTYVDAPELLVPSLVLMVLGAASLLGGAGALRAVWLPAVLLLFSYSVPPVLVNQLIFPTQLATARFVAWLLAWLGIPSWVFGDVILTGDGTFKVIESCSGLRSAAALTMSAVFYVGLTHRGRVRAAVLVAAAPVLGFLANGFRGLSLVLHPSSALAASHLLQGALIFGTGVLALVGLDLLLGRGAPDTRAGSAPGPSGPAPPRGVESSLLRRTMVLGALLAALGAASLWLPRWTPPPRSLPRLSTIPVELDGWRGTGLRLRSTFLGNVRFSEWLHRRYRRGRDEVTLFIGSDDRLERRTSVLSPKTARPDSGWELDERGLMALEPDGRLVESFLLRSRSRRTLVYRWYEGVGELPAEALRSLLVLDRGPFRRPGRSMVVSLRTRVSPKLTGRADAEARLRAFAPLLREALANLDAPTREEPPPDSIEGPRD
jgi:exosortase